MSRVHIIGAGIAGLSAALLLARIGHRVVVHESSPQSGGRARALPDGTDNGTHALIGANTTALDLLKTIGAYDNWVEPEPEGLPVLDVADQHSFRVALSPYGWVRSDLRPPGFSPAALFALARLALPWGKDRPVGPAMARHPKFHRSFVDPLVIAALNTPSDEASAHLLGAVLRKLGGRGATRLLVARRGLGPDLIQPLEQALQLAGGAIRHGSRLRTLQQADGRATVLDFGENGVFNLTDDEYVVLATPPWETTRLLPGIPAPTDYAPIVNLHYAAEHGTGDGAVHFLGVLGGLCQWILLRPGQVSVTVSAADGEAQEDVSALGPRAWAEIRQAARAFGIPGEWEETAPPCRAVKEKRATPRHRPGKPPQPPRQPLANLVLAGDWTCPALPATLEATAQSGLAAARALAPTLPASFLA